MQMASGTMSIISATADGVKGLGSAEGASMPSCVPGELTPLGAGSVKRGAALAGLSQPLFGVFGQKIA
jgi:hypothetical protein